MTARPDTLSGFSRADGLIYGSAASRGSPHRKGPADAPSSRFLARSPYCHAFRFTAHTVSCPPRLAHGTMPARAFAGHAQAPDSTVDAPLFRIETTDGQTLIGTIVSETDDTVVLDSRGVGVVRLPRTEIEHMTPIDSGRFRNGEYWPPNPHRPATCLPRMHSAFPAARDTIRTPGSFSTT